MSLINVSNLSFAYSGSHDYIFENVSFQIDTDWKLGFTGRNGRGKTTFLNLLLGKYEYSGKISASVEFDYFPFAIADKSAPTIQVIDSVCNGYEDWELSRELNNLKLSPDLLDRAFESLSKGEQTKIMLAALFLNENSFLLIDEPTNHLDLAGRQLVGRYLKGKSGFILVSHDRSFLDECVDHVLSINKSNIEIERGNFSSWLANKERRDNYELAENEKLKKEYKRLKETAQKKAEWSDKVEKTRYGTKNSGLRVDRGYVGHKSAKMMKRSKSLEKRQETAAEEKAKLLKNIESADRLKIFQQDYHSSRLLTLDNITIKYGVQPVCRDISFVVEKGERICLSGGNGSGKSSILKLICGEEIPYEGEIRRGSAVEISYVPQDTSHLKGTLSDYAKKHKLEESLLKAMLRKLDMQKEQFEKDISCFSDGQKKKVLIAGSLCDRSHLLVWDEPLNFIDVISRMQIENLILEFEPSILFVEHDRAFVENIATKVVRL